MSITRTPQQVVAANIRKVREIRGIKSAHLASRVGLEASAVTKVEKGIRALKVDELFAFAFALSVSPAVLMTPWGEDDETYVVQVGPNMSFSVSGTEATVAIYDFIVGRLNPAFALMLNPREFANTVPRAVRGDVANAQVFRDLEELGWQFSVDGTVVTSSGGLTRMERTP